MALNVQLIIGLAKSVRCKREELRTRYYEVLFEKYPSLQSVFKAEDKIALDNLFDDALNVITTSFENSDKLEATFLELGHRQRHTNMNPEHFSLLGEALLETLAELFGPEWTKEVESAWDEAIGLTFAIMRRAMEPVKTPSD